MVSFNTIQAVSISAFLLQCLDAAILHATIKNVLHPLELGSRFCAQYIGFSFTACLLCIAKQDIRSLSHPFKGA
jgi:hypothetical protein